MEVGEKGINGVIWEMHRLPLARVSELVANSELKSGDVSIWSRRVGVMFETSFPDDQDFSIALLNTCSRAASAMARAKHLWTAKRPRFNCIRGWRPLWSAEIRARPKVQDQPMSEESFLREVEEELRSDKLKAFWKRYAVFIIGAAILIVAVVAANEVWKWYSRSTAANASAQYYQAIGLAESGDLGGAQQALEELANGGPAGYALLARFRAASLLAEQGDAQGAISAYDALSSAVDNIRLRELALILGAYLAVDTLDAAAVEARAGALAAEDGPFSSAANEALGLAYYKAGDFDRARERFEMIAADANAGQDLQLRAFIYLEQLASQGVALSEEPAAEDPSAALQTEEQPAQ